MLITDALKLFGFETLNDITEDGVKKIYRKLMRKYHPDLVQEDPNKLKEHERIAVSINEAHEILNNVLTEIKELRVFEQLTAKQAEVFGIIPFESLFNIYSGGEITLGSKDSNDKFILNKSNIRAHRIVLCVNCDILYGGVRHSFSKLMPWVLSDEYSIECNIPVLNNTPIDIRIYCYEKEVNLTLRNDTTKLKLRFNNGVVLDVIIQKKFITDEN